jgi:hypothetical protein
VGTRLPPCYGWEQSWKRSHLGEKKQDGGKATEPPTVVLM